MIRVILAPNDVLTPFDQRAQIFMVNVELSAYQLVQEKFSKKISNDLSARKNVITRNQWLSSFITWGVTPRVCRPAGRLLYTTPCGISDEITIRKAHSTLLNFKKPTVFELILMKRKFFKFQLVSVSPSKGPVRV